MVPALTSALAALADPARAEGMAAYMKGQFRFLGVATPIRRRATLPLLRTVTGSPVALAQALWQLDEREYHYVACDLLRLHVKRLSAADLPALEALVQAKSWWDTVDSLAVTVGELVFRQRALVARMDELIRADHLWLRRVALLHQLQWKAETDSERLFRYCREQASEPDFFIRKAIGWALRQYARHNPQAVRQFIAQERTRLSPLSIREAAKHLSN